MSTPSKLLVFGSGFLVRHICSRFMNSGAEVMVIYNRHTVEILTPANQFKKGEINTLDFIADYKPNFILYATGDSFVGDNTDLEAAISKNLMETLNELEQLHKHASTFRFLRKIVVIGSAAEYGKQYSKAISEDIEPHPTTIYGLTKIFLYNTVKYYVEKGLPIVYARQFNSIGPYQREVFVLSSFCKQIALIEKGQQSPKIEVGNLLTQRDFIDARDAANAYYLLFHEGIPGETYNVGSGTAVEIQYLLDTLLRLSAYKGGVIEISQSKHQLLQRNALAERLLSDNKKLKELGFISQYSIDQTIEDTLNYWRSNV